MSETSSLSELAQFVGRSPQSAEDAARRRKAFSITAAGVRPRGPRPTVGELLGIVLVLSARTRRMVLPPVAIDLDVFAPSGARALRLHLPRP